MAQFPKWMLDLAGVNLLPLLASPFFLFGIETAGVVIALAGWLIAAVGVWLLL